MSDADEAQQLSLGEAGLKVTSIRLRITCPKPCARHRGLGVLGFRVMAVPRYQDLLTIKLLDVRMSIKAFPASILRNLERGGFELRESSRTLNTDLPSLRRGCLYAKDPTILWS